MLEEAPVVAVFDLPDLQADRVRQSLYYPPPLQPFVVEGLQSDSRRCVLVSESVGAREGATETRSDSADATAPNVDGATLARATKMR